jgi:hypothetical protein
VSADPSYHHRACVRIYENILKKTAVSNEAPTSEVEQSDSPTSAKSHKTTPEWFAELNPDSKKVFNGAVVEKALNNENDKTDTFFPGNRFQFERVGYFVVDEQTELVKSHAKVKKTDALDDEQIVLNLTVKLKESGLKKEESKVEKLELVYFCFILFQSFPKRRSSSSGS